MNAKYSPHDKDPGKDEGDNDMEADEYRVIKMLNIF